MWACFLRNQLEETFYSVVRIFWFSVKKMGEWMDGWTDYSENLQFPFQITHFCNVRPFAAPIEKIKVIFSNLGVLDLLWGFASILPTLQYHRDNFRLGQGIKIQIFVIFINRLIKKNPKYFFLLKTCVFSKKSNFLLNIFGKCSKLEKDVIKLCFILKWPFFI